MTERRTKWWLHSPQQWFNILLATVTVLQYLIEELRHNDSLFPPVVLKVLLILAVIGNSVMRALPVDNERLTLSKKEDSHANEPDRRGGGEAVVEVDRHSVQLVGSGGGLSNADPDHDDTPA